MMDTPVWNEESAADLDWQEHVEDAEMAARDRVMEHAGTPVVKCVVCGYHYAASTVGPDGACANKQRCLANQATQRNVYGNQTGRAA